MYEDVFNLLSKQDTLSGGKTLWTCQSCSKYSTKLEAMIKSIGQKADDALSRVSTVENYVKDLEKRLGSLEEEGKKKGEQALELQSNTKTAVFGEMAEREMRRLNVIVHGLAEAPDNITNGKERAVKDLQTLQELVSVIEAELEMSDVVRYSTRLGKDESKPRPLMVSFKSIEDKVKLMTKVKALGDKDSPYSGVSIIQDLTKQQRKEEQQLRSNCDELNKNLSSQDSKNWIWKIVGRRGERRLVKFSMARSSNPSQSQMTTRSSSAKV